MNHYEKPQCYVAVQTGRGNSGWERVAVFPDHVHIDGAASRAWSEAGRDVDPPLSVAVRAWLGVPADTRVVDIPATPPRLDKMSRLYEEWEDEAAHCDVGSFETWSTNPYTEED